MRALTALAASLALTATGLWLLHTPAHPAAIPPATSTTAPTTAVSPPAAVAAASSPPSPAVTSPTAGSILPSRVTAASTPTRATATSGATAEAGVLAPGDGPAGDPAVQTLLERSTPNNLPAVLEQQLAQLGRQVWLADVTGTGRARWPAYFTGPGSSGYTQVRVQAAIARRTGTTAVTVTLLWAGTSPGAEPQIGLPGTVKLVQHSGGTWEPIR
ncbi:MULTISPECIES: hypothetical protein [Streptacidiphilus]|uniref:Uncharacterized protein n=1 Tax=Streptacidiphilus cavernicola TaxID=3342716 RepID=A0ABV6UWA6_9ACTN|nr:hypothetical protein [Streptacidiphilus jeojiense]